MSGFGRGGLGLWGVRCLGRAYSGGLERRMRMLCMRAVHVLEYRCKLLAFALGITGGLAVR